MTKTLDYHCCPKCRVYKQWWLLHCYWEESTLSKPGCWRLMWWQQRFRQVQKKEWPWVKSCKIPNPEHSKPLVWSNKLFLPPLQLTKYNYSKYKSCCTPLHQSMFLILSPSLPNTKLSNSLLSQPWKIVLSMLLISGYLKCLILPLGYSSLWEPSW